jgi:hypothetical protein
MTRTHLTLRPGLEALEDRSLPAIIFSAGNLLIANPTSDITLKVTGHTRTDVSVQLNGQKIAHVKNIAILGGKRADNVTIDLNGETLRGSLTVMTGGGNDSITLSKGIISGKLTIKGQDGDDQLQIGTNGAPLTVNGQTQFDLGNGDNTLHLGALGSGPVFGGTLTLLSGDGGDNVEILSANVRGAFTADLGQGNDTFAYAGGRISGALQLQTGLGDDQALLAGLPSLSLVVGGPMSLSDSGGSDALQISDFGGGSTFLGASTISGWEAAFLGAQGTVNFQSSLMINPETDTSGMYITLGGASSQLLTVHGSMTVLGGAANDSIFFLGDAHFDGLSLLSLGGGNNQIKYGMPHSFDPNFSLSFGTLIVSGDAGNDTVELVKATVTGNAYINLGGGDDVFQAFLSQIQGDAYFHLGDGNNLFEFVLLDVTQNLNVTAGTGGDGFLTAWFNVGGNANFNLGNGGTLLTLSANTTVTGDLTFNLGTGTNTLADTAGTTLGGQLRIRTTGGNTTYTANRAADYALDVVFGDGNDSFVYAGTGAMLTGTLKGGGGTNIFTQGTALLDPNFVLTEFS